MGGWTSSMGESMWLDHGTSRTQKDVAKDSPGIPPVNRQPARHPARHQHGDGSKPIWNTLKYPFFVGWTSTTTNYSMHIFIFTTGSHHGSADQQPQQPQQPALGPPTSFQASRLATSAAWPTSAWYAGLSAELLSTCPLQGKPREGEPWGNHDIMGHHGFIILEQRSFQQHLHSIHIQRLVNIDRHWSVWQFMDYHGLWYPLVI